MSADDLIALSPIIILSAAAVAVMVAIAVKRDFAMTTAMAFSGILASLTALGIVWQASAVQVTPLIVVDPYGLFYMTLLLLAGLAVIPLCYGYFKDRAGENEEVMVLLLTALLGGAVLVTSSHFATFFIGLETLSVSLFVLIGYSLEQRRSLEAAVKYLILSGVSSAFLLMGMALIYAESGDLYFASIGRHIASQSDISAMLLTGVIFIATALGFKLSLVPFHMWTSDVYQGAPAPITAFVATVSKGAVFALLLRYFVTTGSYSYASILTVFSIIAVLSIFVGNLLALLQSNVKRILAYSSIAHLGYLLVAFIAGANIGPALAVESVSFYLTAYFITTIGAFGIVSVLSSPQAEAEEIAVYKGLFWRRPWLATTLTVMLLSLAGIPLTAGFIGKFYVFAAGADARLWGLLLTVIAGSGLGLYYYLRIVVEMAKDPEVSEAVRAQIPREWGSSATLAVLTGMLVWFGVFPGWLVDFLQAVADSLV
ncbi:MAG: NADH-quinone oxidoreductase subunit N [Pseudomonadota bacterium]